jgi:DNA-binding transcriptional ArsR family regulator
MATKTKAKPRSKKPKDTPVADPAIADPPVDATPSMNGSPTVAEPAAKKRPAKPETETRNLTSPSRVNVCRDVANSLKMVSDENRVKIAMILLENPGTNVTDLCKLSGGNSQPAMSHHLALMRHGSIVQPVRRGKNNNYELTEKGLKLATMLKGLIDAK